MKRIIFFVLIISFVQVSQAQFSFGLRGGMNFSNLPVETYQLNNPQTRIKTLPDTYTGFHLGVMSEISLGGVFLMPELLFVSTGHDLVLEREGREDNYFQQRFSQLDIPVMIGARIGPLKAGLGPVATILLNSKTELPEDANFEERFNPATYGFQVGAGVNLGSLALDLKYQFGLSNLGDGIQIGDNVYEFDTRPRQFVLSIGLLF
ncbi:MAG: porin family protein [Bacteroidota bacterium]